METMFSKMLAQLRKNANCPTAQTYAVTEKTENSVLLLVEGKVTKLRDF